MSNVTYYKINEDAARRAKEMNSFYEYRPGSATEEYKANITTNGPKDSSWTHRQD